MLVVAVGLAAGCGFELRGRAELPFNEIWIDLPDGDPLRRELASLMSANGVQVVDAGEAAARLTFDRKSLTRRIQSVGANARVREFELVFELVFSVADADGSALVTRASLLLERDYSFEQAEVLGAASEEEFVRREMHRDMAARVLRRIEYAAG